MPKLSAVPIGASARILEICEHAPIAGRVKDLGFTRGARVQCLFASPAGNPRAYAVRGSVVALRNEDAALIAIE